MSPMTRLLAETLSSMSCTLDSRATLSGAISIGSFLTQFFALDRIVEVFHLKADLEKANEDLKAQADPNADTADLIKRYPKAQVRDFDGNPDRLTEMDALVAYLQVLGTMVDVNAPAAQEALAKEKGR